MKTIEELGISPWPWKLFGEHMVCYKNGMCVCNNEGDFHTVSDARLIAAAPDMYDALWDLLFGDPGCCKVCKVREHGHCKTCPLGKAKAAIEKAGGAE